jgi:enediyne biosynthesis protein E5
MQATFFKDARYFQILFQCTFLGYGIFYLGWRAEWPLYATFICTSILTQVVFETIFGLYKNKAIVSFSKLKQGLPSAIISSMGLCLLLKTNSLWIAVFAAFVSIASKYILRIKGKHIFNPSALGIVAAISFTNNAWISPGQWGSGIVILFGTLCLGIIVVTKVQKLDISLVFLGTLAALLFIRQIIYLGWPIDFFVQSLSTGSLLLFSFFMITDPKTTPNHKVARVLWGMAVSAVAFYLATFKFMNGAAIFVLVYAQTLVPLLDAIFKYKIFEWKPTLSSKVCEMEKVLAKT